MSSKKSGNNYFWGVFLLLAGVFLVVSQMGLLPDAGVVEILLTIACVAILINGLAHVSFGCILFSLAFIGILYDKELGITAITPWTILVAALLGTIGLNLIFGKLKRNFRRKHMQGGYEYHHKGIHMSAEKDVEDSQSMEGENIMISTTFSSAIRYVNSNDLRYASISANFGGVTAYFDNASIPTGNAVLNVGVNFSGVEIYVPKSWKVINHVNAVFGGVEEKGQQAEPETATLTLEGACHFGGITIYYV